MGLPLEPNGIPHRGLVYQTIVDIEGLTGACFRPDCKRSVLSFLRFGDGSIQPIDDKNEGNRNEEKDNEECLHWYSSCDDSAMQALSDSVPLG